MPPPLPPAALSNAELPLTLGPPSDPSDPSTISGDASAGEYRGILVEHDNPQ
jgi:hypothetical protein